MRIGPFANHVIPQVEAVLNQHGVPFALDVNQDEFKKQLKDHHSQTVTPAYGERFQPEFAYFEIAAEDFDRVVADLEVFGVAKPSDGSYELAGRDYVCPKCRYTAHEIETCPACRMPMMDAALYAAGKGRKQFSSTGFRNFIAVLLILMLLLFLFSDIISDFTNPN